MNISSSSFKKLLNNPITILAGCILGIIVFIIIIVPAVDKVFMISLHIEARNNSKYLNSLNLLDNHEFQISAAPDGDVITARSSPASAVIFINEKAGKIHKEISDNLTAQGYKVSPNVSNIFYGSSFLVERIGTIATDGVHNLRINYYLNEVYECRELIGSQNLYNCPDDVVTKASLLNRRITKVEVLYNPRSGRPQNINTLGMDYWSN